MACLVAVAHIAGALTSVRAVMESRTSQGAIAWVVSLNTFPYVSVPAFWIFGRSKFQGYVSARRADLLEALPAAKQYVASLIGRDLLFDPDRDRAMLVEKLAKMPFTTGNDAELLVDGEDTFESILSGIEQAQRYVLVEFYILRDDRIGRELQQRLIRKAREGLRVCVLFDEVGSASLSDPYLEELRSAGATALPFNTTQGKANRWQLNFRNHRKIVITDGTTAWVGGHNVGDEYLGRDPKIGPWRDTHLKLTGPIVQSVQLTFFEDWHWASQEWLKLNWDPQPAPTGAKRAALCLPSGPADALETCTLFFLHAINHARERLWIASPYFVPDEQFISALQLAALRGVDVRLLLPEKTDSAMVNLSSWSFQPELEKAGIKVYRYTKGFLHQKVTLIDREFCTVGTANFDNRSFRLNFEITIALADVDMTAKVAQMLQKDFADSRMVRPGEFEDSSFWRRFAIRAARLLSPVQ